jgi:hypothetical protein
MANFTPEDIAKASFMYFFVRVCGGTWEEHHTQWLRDIESNPNVLIECARGHGKSYFFSRFLVWLIYRQLPIKILYVSYSEDQVKFLLKDIEAEIERNPYLVHLRPKPGQIWQAQLFTWPWGAYIRGEGFGSSVRGEHPHFILVDDPLKDQGGMSPEDQWKYFTGALLGTRIRGTKVAVVGTPLDAGDLLEQLETNPEFIFRAYPARKDDGKPLFPHLFTDEELHKIEATVGSLAFAREYLLQRIDPNTQIFVDKFRTLNDLVTFPDLGSVRTIIDPAISEKEKACDSAIVTVGQDYDNHLWEMDTQLLRSDNPKAILDAVVKIAARYHEQYQDYSVVIEAELFQKVLAFDLRQLLLDKGLNVRVIEVRHHGTTGKHQRIVGLQPKWEARQIHLLPASPLIQQFRYYRPNVKGVKIDGIDAFSWMRDEEVSYPFTVAEELEGSVPEEVRE